MAWLIAFAVLLGPALLTAMGRRFRIVRLVLVAGCTAIGSYGGFLIHDARENLRALDAVRYYPLDSETPGTKREVIGPLPGLKGMSLALVVRGGNQSRNNVRTVASIREFKWSVERDPDPRHWHHENWHKFASGSAESEGAIPILDVVFEEPHPIVLNYETTESNRALLQGAQVRVTPDARSRHLIGEHGGGISRFIGIAMMIWAVIWLFPPLKWALARRQPESRL